MMFLMNYEFNHKDLYVLKKNSMHYQLLISTHSKQIIEYAKYCMMILLFNIFNSIFDKNSKYHEHS